MSGKDECFCQGGWKCPACTENMVEKYSQLKSDLRKLVEECERDAHLWRGYTGVSTGIEMVKAKIENLIRGE